MSRRGRPGRRPGPARDHPSLLDFAFLTSRLAGHGAGGLRSLVDGLLARLRPPRWTVEFNPVRGGPPSGATSAVRRPVRGLVLVAVLPAAGTAPERGRSFALRSCAAGLRRAGDAGLGALTLGGAFTGDERLARALEDRTGLRVSSGVVLETAALLEASLVLLRWLGTDPERCLSTVIIDPDRPALGEAAATFLSVRTRRVSVWGLGPRRRRVLAERIRSASGAVVEVPELVLTGGGAPDPASLARDLARVGHGRRPAGAAVVVDLSSRARWRQTGRGGVLRLAGPSDEVRGQGLHPWRRRSLRVGRALFRAPRGWSGPPEPGVPPGLLSAPLVQAVVAALTGSGRRVLSERRLTDEGLAQALRAAAGFGFHLGAVEVWDASPDRSGAP
jgi:hypothetical protein